MGDTVDRPESEHLTWKGGFPRLVELLTCKVVKNLPANVRDTRDKGSLDGEDPMEEEMATHSSILARKIPRTEEPGRLSPQGHKESDTT